MAVARQGSIRRAERVELGASILRLSLIAAGFGLIHAGAGAAEVERVPLQIRNSEGQEVVASNETTRGCGAEAHISEQGKLGKPVRFALADLCGLRGKPKLGSANVRAPAQHRGGVSDRDCSWQGRQRPGSAKLGVERARLAAGEHSQLVQ